MKPIAYILFLFLSFSSFTYGQAANNFLSNEVMEFCDEPASFLGGTSAMHKFIITNLHFPKDVTGQENNSTVYVSFVVNEDGSLTNIRIDRGISKEIDDLVKNMIRQMPPWISASHKGASVKNRVRIPITICLI
jgi:TonB family protein